MKISIDQKKFFGAFIVTSSIIFFFGCGPRLTNDESSPSAQRSAKTAKPSSALAETVEFYNSSNDHYFITANQQEIADLDSGIHIGWARTGEKFFAIPAGYALPYSLPVCRFYGLPQAGIDSHFFTANAAECQSVQKDYPGIWQLETEEAFRIYLPDPVSGECAYGTTPVYRLWNQRADSNHRYTTSLSIFEDMKRKGYIAEGYGNPSVVGKPVAMCAPTAAPATSTTLPSTTIPSTTIPSTTLPPTTTSTTSPPPPPPPTGGNLCAGYTNVIQFPVSWGDFTRYTTAPRGGMRGDAIVVLSFTVPTTMSGFTYSGYTALSEFQGPPTLRHMTVSTQPCDFRPISTPGNGPIAETGGTVAYMYWNVGIQPLAFIPGQTYYFNVRNVQIGAGGETIPGCPYSSCDAGISVIWPH